MPAWLIAQSRQSELMDDPALPAAEHMHALDALARINALSLTSLHIARAITRMLATDSMALQAHRDPGQPLHVVDVACGGGDVTVSLARSLRRRLAQGTTGTRTIDVTGLDISPRAVDRARQRVCRQAARRPCSPPPAGQADMCTVSFAVSDILSDGCPSCDVATCSLFLHHLDDDDAIRLLISLSHAARVGIVVSDLLRTAAGLVLAVVGTAVLSGSRVARVDGPASVRAARTRVEYRELFDRAGLHEATIHRVWPERVLISWIRSAERPAHQESGLAP